MKNNVFSAIVFSIISLLSVDSLAKYEYECELKYKSRNIGWSYQSSVEGWLDNEKYRACRDDCDVQLNIADDVVTDVTCTIDGVNIEVSKFKELYLKESERRCVIYTPRSIDKLLHMLPFWHDRLLSPVGVKTLIVESESECSKVAKVDIACRDFKLFSCKSFYGESSDSVGTERVAIIWVYKYFWVLLLILMCLFVYMIARTIKKHRDKI